MRRTVRNRGLRAVLSLSVVALMGQASGAEIQPLGNFAWSFGEGSEAYGISADGKTAAGRAGGNPGLAMRWTSGSGIEQIGGFDSLANAISADGKTIVGRKESSTLGYEPFRWSEATGMTTISGFPGSSSVDHIANGVSGDDSVVVGEGGSQPWRWTEAGGVVQLGILPGGGASSARAVSEDGAVVVGTSGHQAFRWTEGAGMVGLGDLPGGAIESNAYGISQDGSFVVGQSNSGIGAEAFRWSSSGGMVGLGILPGGSLSRANGVSADGSIAVGWSRSSAGQKAILWTEAGGMVPLWDRLVAEGADLTGWSSLTTATGITPDGNTIIGNGRYEGRNLAFIVHFQPVPEPGTLAVVSLGAGMLIRRRSKRS